MLHKSLAIAALLAASLVLLHAQSSDSNQPPPYYGISVRIDGVHITPIADAPFSAEVLVRNEQAMPDGTVVTKRTINLIGRDSRARIHNERRLLVPENFNGTPRLLEVHIFDPETRLSTYYDPMTHIARQQVLPKPPTAANFSNPLVKVEDLGTDVIKGLVAKGIRRTFTVPAKLSDTGAPVEIVDEYWYSEDLQINLLVRRTDPRTGVQTVEINTIQREEPPPSFFEVPQNYKIVDETPPVRTTSAQGSVTASSPIP
jgi:hypothetical protein